MRTVLMTVIATAAIALAQRPNQQAQGLERTFTSSAEVQAMIEKAKTERKPDQANFLQTLLKLSPYTVSLEYRVQGVDSPPTVHEREAELIYVVEGAGTLTTGGKLAGEKRSNANNLSGTGIDGGDARTISKGDCIFVPEKTPHAFTDTKKTLVIMSIHLPRGGQTE